jgi:mono/diheme cytochrome c family protein
MQRHQKPYRQLNAPRFDLKAFVSRLVLGCLLFSCIELYAQTSAPGGTLTANPVYQQNCAKCHGKTAEGRHFGGPSLVSEKVQAVPDEGLINIITNGKGRMPKYAGKLPEADIQNLVAQIKALSKK